MKLVITIAAAALIAAMPVTAFAGHHGGGHMTARTIAPHAVCAASDCAFMGVHSHDGITSVTHYYGDGHGHTAVHTGHHR